MKYLITGILVTVAVTIPTVMFLEKRNKEIREISRKKIKRGLEYSEPEEELTPEKLRKLKEKFEAR